MPEDWPALDLKNMELFGQMPGSCKNSIIPASNLPVNIISLYERVGHVRQVIALRTFRT